MPDTNPSATPDPRPTLRCRLVSAPLLVLTSLCGGSAVLAGGPPPPSVYPSAAHVGGGSTVVIFGTDIGTDIANTTVSIGGVPATIVANAQHDIEVTVPPRARSGAVNVVVNKLGGPILVSDAFLYRHDHQAGRDFAHTSNPNGPWQIGWAASRTSAFNLITQPPVRSGGGAGCLHVWLRNGNDVPAVGRNRNNATCYESTWIWPAGAIGGHPSNDGSNAVVRFVVPATTAYHVYGDFTGSDPQPTTSDGAVLRNGSEVFSANVGYNVPQAFDLHLDLNAGDTLDFTIGHGGNGYAYDQTAMQIHIVGDLLHDDGFE